ncbi:MAG: hypothetical protein ACYCZ6_07140 [Polaromonas sp.]
MAGREALRAGLMAMHCVPENLPLAPADLARYLRAASISAEPDAPREGSVRSPDCPPNGWPGCWPGMRRIGCCSESCSLACLNMWLISHPLSTTTFSTGLTRCGQPLPSGPARSLSHQREPEVILETAVDRLSRRRHSVHPYAKWVSASICKLADTETFMAIGG